MKSLTAYFIFDEIYKAMESHNGKCDFKATGENEITISIFNSNNETSIEYVLKGFSIKEIRGYFINISKKDFAVNPSVLSAHMESEAFRESPAEKIYTFDSSKYLKEEKKEIL